MTWEGLLERKRHFERGGNRLIGAVTGRAEPPAESGPFELLVEFPVARGGHEIDFADHTCRIYGQPHQYCFSANASWRRRRNQQHFRRRAQHTAPAGPWAGSRAYAATIAATASP